jgi:hypothetical protein
MGARKMAGNTERKVPAGASTKKRSQKRPKKGALIKGMLKTIPASMLTDPSFEEELAHIMRGYSGIYALYKNKSLYYVGLTNNLRNRIKSHQKDRSKHWDSFAIFRIKRIDFLKDIETLLIRVADPPGNKSKGNVPKDKDLTRILRALYKERSRSLKEIGRALR